MSKRELPFPNATELVPDGSTFNLSSNSTISNVSNNSNNSSKNTTNLSNLIAGVPVNSTTPTSNNNNYTNISTPKSNKQVSESKRRRVTRACDNCRQKKVKCDGKQPCIHCTVYSYKCSYDQPNIRNKRNSGIPAPAQPSVAVLQAAAAAAAANAANASIENEGNEGAALYPTSNLIVCQQILNILLPKLKFNCFDQNVQFDVERFQKLVSYVETRSPEFTQNINEICDYMQDPEVPIHHLQVHHNLRKASISSNDDTNSITPGTEIKLYLPNKETALQLIYTTWNKGCVLFRFYHRPSLLEEVDLLYSLDPSNYGDRQQRFLPFLYSILACGCLFSRSSATAPDINENSEDDGFKYFLEARKLIDISNVGDINSIQTIVMMIIYLQCSARLSTCYSYIGIAMRSALKEGLHRNLSIFQNSRRKLDPIEIDTRKRLFYTIYKMDIYINSLLGLPRSINEDEFDQELPAELDDENITRTEYLYDKQQGRLSSSGCANHHTKLMLILSHIIKQLYPIKVKNADDELTSSANHYSPDRIHKKVTDLELELKNWLHDLPAELKPTDPNVPGSNKAGEKFVLANYYLHLAFLNCQIMLYRPFIHFISDGNSKGVNSDPRSLIRGRNCIKVARMVVKLANKMIDQNLLVGTYWFSIYTIFFSIACLVYYFHFANYASNRESGVNYAGVLFDDDLNIDMIKQDIEIGKKVLDCLKNSSRSSSRIYNILNTLFEQLNRRTATTSRLRVDGEVPGDANADTNPETVPGARPNVKSEHVQNTFKNFDTINNFESSPSESSYAAYAKRDLGQLFDETNLAQYQSSAEATQSDSSKLEPIHETATTNSEDETNADYLPGVFDKLDTQIFGKILPPYMLESNANYEQNHPQQQQQQQQATAQPIPPQLPPQILQQQLPGQGPMQQMIDPATNPQLQMMAKVDGVISPYDNMGVRSTLNLDDFDFYSINSGDSSGMQYLDPFDPVNGR
ncbi:uncharacterized protein SPAPADRAFT_49410 [Spathaspora passalidarum NRRL Y-27907]|uniref:Uncharacterized protein GIN1 n=1 Tax=Spathaspora passalidarum (strain NRRL Y-27907 / 11-Y1) TaxID=619300 RepID=G3AI52_SPAPN|nr:uncharacterized protein SPAPADRAFT_49410 [Spathaspora passalidarum NRRL Y-27907]EGW34366.1 hypothetical protein SPAPADRAFT_49410 [Spathaspora passalidarum NRRL Y-27907]